LTGEDEYYLTTLESIAEFINGMSDKDLKMEEDEYKRLCEWSVKDSENDRKIKEEAAQVELADLLEMDQKPSSKAALDTTTSSSKTDKKDKKKDGKNLESVDKVYKELKTVNRKIKKELTESHS
tara:strand:+ start:805 stop:1176 length:372 start_codon:yes stop_codon:yes gene_type:complete